MNCNVNGQQKAQKGWLSRWTRKQWSRHWFVLKNGSLTYYRGPAAELCSFLDGVLDLSLIKQIEVQASEETRAESVHSTSSNGNNHSHYAPLGANSNQASANQQAQFTFSLKMWNGECHLLGAATSAERSLWLEAIQASSSLSCESDRSIVVGDDEIATDSSSAASSSSESSPTSNLWAKSTDNSNSSSNNNNYQQQQLVASLDHQLALSLKSAISRRREQEKQLLELALSNSLSAKTDCVANEQKTIKDSPMKESCLERQQLRALSAIRHHSAQPEMIIRGELGARKTQQQQELRKGSASEAANTLIDTRSVKTTTTTSSQKSNENKPQERSSQARSEEEKEGNDEQDDEQDDEKEDEDEEENEDGGEDEEQEDEDEADCLANINIDGCSSKEANSQAFKRRLMCAANSITNGDEFDDGKQVGGELKLIGRRQQADLYQKRAFVSGAIDPALSSSRSADSSSDSEADEENVGRKGKGKENGLEAEQKVARTLAKLTGGSKFGNADDIMQTLASPKPFERPNSGDKEANKQQQQQQQKKKRVTFDLSLSSQRQLSSGSSCSSSDASDSESSASSCVSSSDSSESSVSDQEEQQEECEAAGMRGGNEEAAEARAAGSAEEASVALKLANSANKERPRMEAEAADSRLKSCEGSMTRTSSGCDRLILQRRDLLAAEELRLLASTERPQEGVLAELLPGDDEQPMDAICSGEQEAVVLTTATAGSGSGRRLEDLAALQFGEEPVGGSGLEPAGASAEGHLGDASSGRGQAGCECELRRRLELAQASVGLLEQRLSGSLASYQQLELAYKRLQAELANGEQLHRAELARMQTRQDELSRELASSQTRLAEARAKLLKFEANHQLPTKALVSWLKSAHFAGQGQTSATSIHLTHQNHSHNQPQQPHQQQHLLQNQNQNQHPLLLTMHHVKQQGGFGAMASQQQTTLSLKLLNQSKQIQRKLNELEIKVDRIQSSGGAAKSTQQQQPLVS